MNENCGRYLKDGCVVVIPRDSSGFYGSQVYTRRKHSELPANARNRREKAVGLVGRILRVGSVIDGLGVHFTGQR